MIGYKVEQLMSTFAFGIAVGLLIGYLIHQHLESIKFDDYTSLEQQNSLQQTHEVLKQFRVKNFSPVSSPLVQGKDQCPISDQNSKSN